MPICGKCNQDLSVENFSKSSQKKTGHNYICKECHRKYCREYYKKNKKEYIEKAAIYSKKKREDLGLIKEQMKCSICLEDDSCCLDFHHINPEEKSDNISKLAVTSSRDKLLEEIKKCVVLCSNCHRKLHAGKIKLNKDSDVKAETIVHLQVGDVLGMIGSHIGMKYNKKVTEVKPVFKLDEFSVKILSHFEVRFEQELSDTFGE